MAYKKKRKKTSKYKPKKVGLAFGRAAKYSYKKYKEHKSYKSSPQYRKKLEAARKQRLKDLDYKIKMEKKRRQLARTMKPKPSVSSQVKKPLGIDLGKELGLN